MHERQPCACGRVYVAGIFFKRALEKLNGLFVIFLRSAPVKVQPAEVGGPEARFVYFANQFKQLESYCKANRIQQNQTQNTHSLEVTFGDILYDDIQSFLDDPQESSMAIQLKQLANPTITFDEEFQMKE